MKEEKQLSEGYLIILRKIREQPESEAAKILMELITKMFSLSLDSAISKLQSYKQEYDKDLEIENDKTADGISSATNNPDVSKYQTSLIN